MSEQNGNNVIKFPVQNKGPRKPKGQRPQGQPADKHIVGMVLIMLFALTIVVNRTMPSSSEGTANLSSHGRSIASVNETRDVKWEHDLARRLSEENADREIASLGQTPSAEDRLRYGFFGSGYRLRFDEGKIAEIELVKQGEPKYLGDRRKFLESYRELFPGDFRKANPSGVEADPMGLVETFTLVDDQDHVVANVAFSLDSSGRLIRVKVNKDL